MSNELAVNMSTSLLAPENFEHWQRVANMMAKSNMVPKNYQDKMQDVLLAMEYGSSLGLAPLAAVQNIAIINGRPSIYGDAVLAICSGHPKFEDIIEEPILSKDNAVEGYRCTVKRKGRSDVTQVFTVEDAKKAGLWGKSGPWTNYAVRMLQMRARSFALRDAFSDALGGVRVVEEVQDYIDITPEHPKLTKKKQKNQAAEDVLNSVLDDGEE